MNQNQSCHLSSLRIRGNLLRLSKLFWQSADRSVAVAIALVEAMFVWESLHSHAPLVGPRIFGLAFAILLAVLIFRAEKRETTPPDADGLIGLCLVFFAPSLYKPNEFVIDNDIVTTIYVLSVVFYFSIALWGYLALKSSIAILPGNRPIINSGPYRMLRHPIYSAFFHISACNLAFSPSIRNLLAMALFGVGIFLRARNEERILVGAVSYQELQVQVPARFSTVFFSLPAAITIALLGFLQFS